MADILHRIGIKTSSIDDVYQALTTERGLADWWTSNTQEKVIRLAISLNSALEREVSI